MLKDNAQMSLDLSTDQRIINEIINYIGYDYYGEMESISDIAAGYGFTIDDDGHWVETPDNHGW